MEKETTITTEKITAITELERAVNVALETYSNVHRGSGHNSMVTTCLFEQARDIILEYLGLKKGKYIVIFCTPRRAAFLKAILGQKSQQSLSSRDIGLSLGVTALIVRKKDLPKGPPFETGGGTTRIVSPDWVIWAKGPEKFEAGTPAIINIIAFAKALLLTRQYGKDIFRENAAAKRTATEILYQDELGAYSGKELLDKLRQTLIGRNLLVPTTEGDRPFINLDNGASTPTFTPVWNAVHQTWHQSAQVQKEIIKEVRSICSQSLGAPLSVYEVIFTSNTTEAINLAAESFSRESDTDVEPLILSTLLEHSSNDLPWRKVTRYPLLRLKVDNQGFFDLTELDKILSAYNHECRYGKKRIKLVALSGASNVMGTYNDLPGISQIVHRYGARLVVDAAQMVAHRKLDIEKSDIDYLAFSAHKVYAPFGCGVLVVKKGLLTFSSAELELIQSSGEDNAGGIAALGKALLLLQRIGMDLVQKEEQVLTAQVLLDLSKIPGLKIYGMNDTASSNFSKKGGVILFDLKGVLSKKLANKLAMHGGIGVRYGCHCAHIMIKHLLGFTPFLARLQGIILTLFPKLELPGLARVSLGIQNTEEEIDKLILELEKISGKSRKLRNSNPIDTIEGRPILTEAEVKLQMKEFCRSSAHRVYGL